MSARLLDGNAIARAIREEVTPGVAAFTRRAGRPPGLGIVLVGDDPASHVYVRNKIRAGMDAGLFVDLQHLPATASLDDVTKIVERLNHSDAHDGILVQSPLPAAMGARPSGSSSTSSIRPRTSTASAPATSGCSSRSARDCARAHRRA